MLSEEDKHIAGNRQLTNVMSAAIDYPGLFDASGKVCTSPYQMQGGHLACALVLLKAACSMTDDQTEKLLTGRKNFDKGPADDIRMWSEVGVAHCPLHLFADLPCGV